MSPQHVLQNIIINNPCQILPEWRRDRREIFSSSSLASQANINILGVIQRRDTKETGINYTNARVDPEESTGQ